MSPAANRLILARTRQSGYKTSAFRQGPLTDFLRETGERVRVTQLAFFEDGAADGLEPVSLLRPAFELVCGQGGLRERALRALAPEDWGVFIRESLVEVYREQFPEAHVNRWDWLNHAPTLFLNSQWLCDVDSLRDIDLDTVGVRDGQVVYVCLHPHEAELAAIGDISLMVQQLARLRTKRVEAPGHWLANPWQLIEQNSSMLARDFAALRGAGGEQRDRPDVTIIGPRDQVWIDPTAEIEPYVVVDTRPGPVSIAAGVVIQAFTRIEGPAHIGAGSRLYRASVKSGVTIGPDCRVGGEVECSILQANVNKYHDGFLGHAYVCPWVNLGAQTANSDLKSDYSPVRFARPVGSVSTGLKKVGCFIGDHTKTGLGSLINTGSHIGVMAMVLPSGGLLPRFIPSFATVWNGELTESISIDRCFAAAAVAMERRNHEFTPAQQRLLRQVHRQTAAHREARCQQPSGSPASASSQ